MTGLADVQEIKAGKPREGMRRFRTGDLLEAYQEIARGIGGLGGEIEKPEMERFKGGSFTYECAANSASYNTTKIRSELSFTLTHTMSL